MKEVYEVPHAELVELVCNDIILSSGGSASTEDGNEEEE